MKETSHRALSDASWCAKDNPPPASLCGNRLRRHPMSGVVGVVGITGVNQVLYDALTVLQHRGQDAAGIMTSDMKRLYLRKANGLVRDVFQQKHMLRLRGNMG